MQPTGSREDRHTIVVQAPAARVYELIADVEQWPQLFPPTIHAERIEHSGNQERIRIWATANGDVKGWTSRRTLDPAARRIDFRQEVSAPPVAAMGGSWILEPLDEHSCRVALLHDYRAVDDDPEKLEWISQAVDRNSTAELAALKTGVETLASGDDRLLSFEDSVRVHGSAKDLFDFINRADLWAERLPHVARVELTEDTPGLQILEMDTRSTDGTTHTTRSVRVCLDNQRIVYKQLVLPALLSLHTGRWTFVEDGDSTIATSQHTVVINTDRITDVLGAGADLAQARKAVREALGANSRATLGLAKAYAEERR
ncbi:MAG: aromatase/cyclase [Thermobifida fusca]|jgi:aromatase|uniref:aromatase/cyclase n=1 Tax=Thermobifida fusca TaxID=2021 RepID=UPI000CED9949|nr:aromatase/cyclase [Thermobifida fusca]PPS91604.1 cyclase [Thermobifida fusca]